MSKVSKFLNLVYSPLLLVASLVVTIMSKATPLYVAKTDVVPLTAVSEEATAVSEEAALAAAENMAPTPAGSLYWFDANGRCALRSTLSNIILNLS